MSAPLRGWVRLVGEAVDSGSRAIERIQRDTARRTYAILERIPLVEGPTRVVRAVHEASLTAVHEAIRTVNRLGVALVTEVALPADPDDGRDRAPPPAEGPPSAGGSTDGNDGGAI